MRETANSSTSTLEEAMASLELAGKIFGQLDEEKSRIEQRYVENPERQSLPDTLHAIFRLSFKYSAGSHFVQSLLQIRAAELLILRHGEEALIQATDSTELDPRRLIPPKNHAQGSALEGAEERLPNIWDFFLQICRNSRELSQLQPRDKMGIRQIRSLSRIAPSDAPYRTSLIALMGAESKYMEAGRPNKESPEDKFRSYIHDHAIKKIPTGNAELDVIFAEIGMFIQALRCLDADELKAMQLGSLREKLEHFTKLWESHHGQDFYKVTIQS